MRDIFSEIEENLSVVISPDHTYYLLLVQVGDMTAYANYWHVFSLIKLLLLLLSKLMRIYIMDKDQRGWGTRQGGRPAPTMTEVE